MRLWFVLLLTGCATEVVRYASVPLPLPAKPELPVVSRTELQCLPEDVYSRLAYRELLIRKHVEVQAAVICSTHPKGGQDCKSVQ